jgi:FtsP/CotA-like multicopper oxidase with cupredoxin domain
MRRQSFIRLGAGTMAVAALPQLSERALASDVVDYRLVSTPLRFSPAPGVNFAGLAYNGTIPGPLLRVMYGQRVRVRYINHTNVQTTVHWHGMILPNDMDGVAYVTQPPVMPGGEFLYEFAPQPPGTRWYHDHAMKLAVMRGLYGMFIVDDPREKAADSEFALVFHDIPQWSTVEAALRGVSTAPMMDPIGSPEMLGMKPDDKMGDEVAYIAHCINGECYPATKKLPVKVGDRVRLRILNASPTQTRYVRLGGHRLTVTHSDGNPMPRPIEVEALRIGVAERYDAVFEVAKPGAFLLQGISSDPLAYQQAVVLYTEGMENASPVGDPEALTGVDYFTYQKAGGVAANPAPIPPHALEYQFHLGGGKWGSNAWTINGKKWPDTPKILVRHGDAVVVHFHNTTDMDHPMHLHGHVFQLVEVGGTNLAYPLSKDVSLVPANGGTATWHFTADSPPGRWLLHCHNEIHMMDGMMTEVDYRT